MSSISATIGGLATIVQRGSDEGEYYCDQHLANNTYEDGNPLFRLDSNSGDAARSSHFVDDGEVSVIVVKIKDVRISDWKGTVRDWALVPTAERVNGTL
jgi:hypothetical protein